MSAAPQLENAPAEASGPLIALDDVHSFYGNIEALQGVSLTVGRGEIVTLIGANGAGKSTTLKTISGLIHPRQGTVTFEGRDISRVPAHRLVHDGIGHAPEGRRIFTRMSVYENLLMGAFTRDLKTVQPDVDRVMTLFPRLRERTHQLGGTLSGGEQQMLAIARALMSNPTLLILDEPSTGLAPTMVESIFRTIQDLHRRGTMVLLVEQNAHIALELASRAYVLEHGSIVAEGPAAALRQDARVMAAYLG